MEYSIHKASHALIENIGNIIACHNEHIETPRNTASCRSADGPNDFMSNNRHRNFSKITGQFLVSSKKVRKAKGDFLIYYQ